MGKKSKSKGVVKKNNEDGTPNPKYVDLLEVDRPIAGQNFGCFSFISPEKIIKQRELFFFEEFLKTWEVSKSMEKFNQFLNFICYKYRIKFEDINSDFEEFIKEERETIIHSGSLEADYKNFLDNNEHEVEKKFNTKHKFQTSVRAFKSRGNFSTQEEAELRANMLREADPNFDIFVGPIGVWLPWEPEAYKTGRVEYMEEELNQLAHEKKKNEDAAKNAFEQRIKETKKKAIEENKKNSDKYGGTITQDVDEDGNLIGIGTSEPNKVFGQNDVVSIDDIRNNLFEGDNIVTGETDHGKSQLLSGPFAESKE